MSPNLCPVCSNPMSLKLNNGLPRQHCSRQCAAIAHGRARWHGNRDVDDMAVIRILAGDPPATTTKGERMAAVQTLTVQGRSAAWIAGQLRVTRRSVNRYRSENRREATK